MPLVGMFIIFALVLWWQAKQAKREIKAKKETEENQSRPETLADSLSACHWMDEHISYCRQKRIHCEEDKQCCCEKCDEARYLKEHREQCKVCGGVRGYSDEQWLDHARMYQRYVAAQNPIKGDRLEHNGAEWTLVQGDLSRGFVSSAKKQCIHCARTLHPERLQNICIHCKRAIEQGKLTVDVKQYEEEMAEVYAALEGNRYV